VIVATAARNTGTANAKRIPPKVLKGVIPVKGASESVAAGGEIEVSSGRRSEERRIVTERHNHVVLARDLMQREVVTVREDVPLADLADLLQQARIHGAPVVSADGRLVGIVSQEDVLFGSMSGPPGGDGDTLARGGAGESYVTRVGDIMTSPPVTATEETNLRDLCKLMWRLRLRHVPIVEKGKLTGIVSSMDLCRAIADGTIAG
jgi:CBS domain-containing protein